MRIVVISILLAGCLGPTSGNQAQQGEDEVPFTVDESCDVAAFLMLIDRGEADPFLPPGYHARDASDLVLAPVASQRHLFVATAAQCETGNLSWFSFFVHPPQHAAGLTASAYAFYDIYHVGSQEWLGELLDRPASLGQIHTGVSEVGGNATIWWPHGYLKGNITAANEFETDQQLFRFWHDDTLRSYFDLQLQPNVEFGYAECGASKWHFAPGLPTCEPVSTLGLFQQNVQLTASLRRMP